MRPYVYELTDNVNGMKYIGCRYAKGCDPLDLGVTYFTSRPEVRNLWLADTSRFSKKIIAVGNVEYVRDLEHNLIVQCDAVASDQYYNRSSRKIVHPDDLIRSGKKTGPIEGVKNRELKRGVCGRSAEKMVEDGKKGARVFLESISKQELMLKMTHMRTFITSDGRARANAALLKEAVRKTKEERSLMGKKGGLKGGPKACLLTNSQIWRCLECGMETKVGPLGKHQKRKNHKGKIRVT